MASQPLDEKQIDALIRKGYPVFGPEWIARVKAEMNAIEPLVPSDRSAVSSEQKYSTLASLIKYRSRVVEMKPGKPEPLVMPEGSGKKHAEQLSKQFAQLLEENLVHLAPGSTLQSPRYQLTDQGRRFMADYEKEHHGERK
jgi:hypothetical protein